MVNDENNGSVQLGEDGGESFAAAFNPREHERIDGALDFSRTCSAAGATSVRWTGLLTTHVQGTCRMGSDPERSVVDADGQSWDVKRLYVGDGSLVPHTLSVNPSLTIMALADRLADHLTPTRTGTSHDRADPRPRAPLARRAADAEAGREPLLLPRDPRHGGLRRERRLGLPARLRRLRALLAQAHRLAQSGVGHLAYRTHSPEALERRVAALEAGGVGATGSTATSATAAPTASSIPTATASSSSTSPSATRRRRSCARR